MLTLLVWGGALLLLDYNQPVNVQGYDPSQVTRTFRTASGAVAYTHPHTGTRYHLIVHQAVSVPEMGHHLLCPMQCRARGHTVNECPRMYAQHLTQESHSVVVTDEHDETVVLHFFLSGVTSMFTVKSLDRDEF